MFEISFKIDNTATWSRLHRSILSFEASRKTASLPNRSPTPRISLDVSLNFPVKANGRSLLLAIRLFSIVHLL